MTKENKHQIYVSKHWIEHYLNKARIDTLDNSHLSDVDAAKIFSALEQFQNKMKFVYKDMHKLKDEWKYFDEIS